MTTSTPPPLSFYIDEKKDNAATKLAKQEWYETVKKKQPVYSFNEDAVAYCNLDVAILREACCKALASSFQFQDFDLIIMVPSCVTNASTFFISNL